MGQDDEQTGEAHESWGIAAEGALTGSGDTTGRPGRHHWLQSTITEPSLDARGGVFFAAVEMTRMPMILSDPRQADNPIVFANNAFLDLTGYDVAEILGRNCRFLQGPGTDRDAVRQMREAIEARQAIAIEVLNYRRDGSPFWNAVFLGPVYDAAGELLYFFASQLDVTRRRESEDSFRQAQKMEAIGQLTAGVAHDFNNLLHVINGSLERIAARPDDAVQLQRYLRAASTAAERGARLTQQLLAFARRSRLEPRAVEVSGLITSISELLDSSVGSKNELVLHLRRRLPEVSVDPVHLEMALINVLVNARDASPRGGTITVQTSQIHLNGDAPARQLTPGAYVVVAVSDEGDGMTPEVMARATEPFFTTKRVGEGTGLGLAMAQGFVQQSGGRLELESTPGAGTTVRMLFPVYAPRDTAPQEPRTGGYQPTAVDAAEPPLILVVEDVPEIAAMAEETLRETGYRVVTAATGEDALRRFEDLGGGDRVALVFSDVVMPGGMNGLELALEIRKRAPNVPILMTTGYNDEMALQGPRPDAMDVLGKPYRRGELLDRVQAALRQGAGRDLGRQTSSFGVAEA